MTRVLAIHLDKMLAEPLEGESLKSLARHVEYKKRLDYYAIITKTFACDPKPAFQPTEGMDVIGTNSKNRYWFLRDAYRIGCKMIEKKGIDVITVQDQCWLGLLGLALRKKYKIPLNVQVHWEFVKNPYFKHECLEYRLWDAIGRFVLPRADTYYVGTSKQKKDMIEYGIDAERIFYTPFTILMDKFEIGDPAQIRGELRAKGFAKMLLWVGRMVKQKDIGTLLKAAALVSKEKPNTVLVLLGRGPERKLVERTIRDLKIVNNIIMPGFLPQQECINYYHAADVVCISSLYEGTCRIFLEAMAAAKPIVTTDVAGAFDAIIDGQTGHIIGKGDSESMARAILKLLDDKAAAREMGLAGRELLRKHFTMQRHYDGFVNMWNETKRYRHEALI